MQFNGINKQSTVQSAIAAGIVAPMLLGAFFAFEPIIAKGAEQTSSFQVSQEITSELAFVTAPNNVTMISSIPGVTGGISNGTSTFSIKTNNQSGYTVRIQFENATSALRFATSTDAIPNIGTVNHDFTLASNTAAFGLTMSGPNVAQLFKSSGGDCNQEGGTATGENCWTLPDTSSTTLLIVDSNDQTANTGEVHNIHFRVKVMPDPTPVLRVGIYTATATLTAIEK
jgi:hypothetical protein